MPVKHDTCRSQNYGAFNSYWRVDGEAWNGSETWGLSEPARATIKRPCVIEEYKEVDIRKFKYLKGEWGNIKNLIERTCHARMRMVEKQRWVHVVGSPPEVKLAYRMLWSSFSEEGRCLKLTPDQAGAVELHLTRLCRKFNGHLFIHRPAETSGQKISLKFRSHSPSTLRAACKEIVQLFECEEDMPLNDESIALLDENQAQILKTVRRKTGVHISVKSSKSKADDLSKARKTLRLTGPLSHMDRAKVTLWQHLGSLSKCVHHTTEVADKLLQKLGPEALARELDRLRELIGTQATIRFRHASTAQERASISFYGSKEAYLRFEKGFAELLSKNACTGKNQGKSLSQPTKVSTLNRTRGRFLQSREVRSATSAKRTEAAQRWSSCQSSESTGSDSKVHWRAVAPMGDEKDPEVVWKLPITGETGKLGGFTLEAMDRLRTLAEDIDQIQEDLEGKSGCLDVRSSEDGSCAIWFEGAREVYKDIEARLTLLGEKASAASQCPKQRVSFVESTKGEEATKEAEGEEVTKGEEARPCSSLRPGAPEFFPQRTALDKNAPEFVPEELWNLMSYTVTNLGGVESVKNIEDSWGEFEPSCHRAHHGVDEGLQEHETDDCYASWSEEELVEKLDRGMTDQHMLADKGHRMRGIRRSWNCRLCSEESTASGSSANEESHIDFQSESEAESSSVAAELEQAIPHEVEDLEEACARLFENPIEVDEADNSLDTLSFLDNKSDEGNHVWWYLDDEFEVQGPFQPEEMRDWYADDFLPDDLLVRRSESSVIEPSKDSFASLEIVLSICRDF